MSSFQDYFMILASCVFMVQAIKSRPQCMPGKQSTAELHLYYDFNLSKFMSQKDVKRLISNSTRTSSEQYKYLHPPVYHTKGTSKSLAISAGCLLHGHGWAQLSRNCVRRGRACVMSLYFVSPADTCRSHTWSDHCAR